MNKVIQKLSIYTKKYRIKLYTAYKSNLMKAIINCKIIKIIEGTSKNRNKSIPFIRDALEA